ncbi:uncharacterized protein LOC126719956 [Quercus robur]|uniref:uncharacterized protein LOC126719956 n=1 Tax=Quercus robur TaxID=38942 RepID=UPI00216245EF|nr:uncharacterized protein LOC126719956 [Quercus robur]
MDFAQLLQLSLFSQILSSSMGDHDDCVTHPYYYVSLVIATLIGALTSYMFTIMYHPDPALTAASAFANNTQANSAPNTGGGHNTGSGSGGHATSASGQNSDSIAVQAAAGSGLNSDHSTRHVLGPGRSSGGRSNAALGSGRSSDATLSFYSVATLGSGRSSDAAFSFGQNSDFITIHEAAGSGPNSERSTGHALGSDGPSDPTTDHAALVAGTDSGCHATLDSGPSSGPTTAIAASGSGPSSSPTTDHDASCKDPTAALFNATFFNAVPLSSDSDDEAH